MIVAGKDCQSCIYNEPIDKFYNHCKARDKKYHYGQWVPCEDKRESDIQAFFIQKKEEDTKNTENTELENVIEITELTEVAEKAENKPKKRGRKKKNGQ